ncbi:MAG: hypothetical protein S4CHLAM20_09710 [Chlamydiia bacterium]|nr:hypothetical protein [Chlamydiia bacterium]
MKILYKLLVLLLTISSFCNEVTSMSVIIPCAHSHVQYLPELLEALKSQTVSPVEAVLSISELKNEDYEIIDYLKGQHYPFDLKIFTSKQRLFAGQNRNIAIQNSIGELIVSQDADDLPHPQRLEFINNTYQKTHFNLLIHMFVKHDFKTKTELPTLIENYNNLYLDPSDPYFIDLSSHRNVMKNILYIYAFSHSHLPKFKYYKNKVTNNIAKELDYNAHCGNCVFQRDIFKKLQYSKRRSGEDVQFFKKVFRKFNNCLLIPQPLVFYINSRTTYYERIK